MGAVKEKGNAWDCGTGNGQVATELANYFRKVSATDISQHQLNQAPEVANIEYLCCRAEQTPFAANQFDLVTVAQAIHWFDFEAFYREVQRTAKEGGIIAYWGYGLLRTDGPADTLIHDFYKNVVGPYWDAERHYIDEAYQTIPFPFRRLPVPDNLSITTHWDRTHLEGYLNTWSSVQRFVAERKYNPVDELIVRVSKGWPDTQRREVKFPLFLHMGVVLK